MTISSTTSRVDYTGNGATDTYPYTFRIFSNTDLQVTVRDTDGVETELVLTTDYTVTGVGASGGGNVVLVDDDQDWLDADGDLLTDYTLTIRRVRPLTQGTDIRNQGSFFPETHENAFDHQIMVDQQQQDEINRSVKLPETVASGDFDTALPADITDAAEKVPLVNAAGDGFADAADWPSGTDIADAAANAATAVTAAAQAAADAATSLYRWGGTAGGTADALTLTPATALAAYAAGIRFAFLASGTNTGAATVNISGLGVKNIRTQAGSALAASQIQSGGLYVITYDGTDFRLTDPTASTFNVVVDEFSGDGSDTTFELSRDPGSENAIIVVVDGVETLVKDRSLSGTTLTFASAPPVGTNNINVFHIGVAVAIGAPSDATVTGAKLATSAADGSTLEVAGGSMRVKDDGVTFAKIQNITTSRLLGRTTASSGDIEQITVGNGLSLAATNLAADFAVQADMETPSSAVKVVSPSMVNYHPGVAKVWCQAGITGSIVVSHNMTSVTDTGTGDITFTIATDFSSADYVAMLQADATGSTTDRGLYLTNPAVGSIRGFRANSAGTAVDPTTWYFAAWGDQ